MSRQPGRGRGIYLLEGGEGKNVPTGGEKGEFTEWRDRRRGGNMPTEGGERRRSTAREGENLPAGGVGRERLTRREGNIPLVGREGGTNTPKSERESIDRGMRRERGGNTTK